MAGREQGTLDTTGSSRVPPESSNSSTSEERPLDENGSPLAPPHRRRCRAIRDFDLRRCKNPRAVVTDEENPKGLCALCLHKVTITTITDVPPRSDRDSKDAS